MGESHQDWYAANRMLKEELSIEEFITDIDLVLKATKAIRLLKTLITSGVALQEEALDNILEKL